MLEDEDEEKKESDVDEEVKEVSMQHGDDHGME